MTIGRTLCVYSLVKSVCRSFVSVPIISLLDSAVLESLLHSDAPFCMYLFLKQSSPSSEQHLTMADGNSIPYWFIGPYSGEDIKGIGRVNQIEDLFDPSACHKSVYIDWPADLIGLEDPSQAPLYWEIVPVRKTGQADLRNKCFKEPKAEENETQSDIDLTLRLHPPESVQEDKLPQLGPSSSKRPTVDGKNLTQTKEYDGPSLVVMECKACYLPVMVSEIAPECPLCKRSSSLLDRFRSRY